jgi:hypothetical protein
MSGLSAKVRVARLAERQWGRVGAAQLVAMGVDTRVTARWVGQGYLVWVLPRVYAVGHGAPSVEADLVSAVLYAGPGAMLSHATALWWLGLIDKRPWPIQVSTSRRCRSLHGIEVHGRRGAERVWHKRLPTTTVNQALLDYAAVSPFARVRHALATADYQRLLDLDALRAITGCGRPGSANLRNALTRHEPRLARTRSPLERIFVPLCERFRIPAPEINAYVEGIEVDSVWRDHRLVVELDGRDNHSSWAQIQRDRRNELTLRGGSFDVIRYGWEQVEDRPELVGPDLLAQLARRRSA